MNLLAVQQMPRRLYQASCNHVFGDAMCGYDRVPGRMRPVSSTGIGAVTIAALAGSTQAQIVDELFAQAPRRPMTRARSRRSRGRIAARHGRSAALTGGVVRLLKPWLSPVSVGDTFQLLPGCDHTTETCQTVLQNIARFGGFPYVPPPELAA